MIAGIVRHLGLDLHLCDTWLSGDIPPHDITHVTVTRVVLGLICDQLTPWYRGELDTGGVSAVIHADIGDSESTRDGSHYQPLTLTHCHLGWSWSRPGQDTGSGATRELGYHDQIKIFVC